MNFPLNAQQLGTLVDLHLGFRRAKKVMGSKVLGELVMAKNARLNRQMLPPAQSRVRVKGRVVRLP